MSDTFSPLTLLIVDDDPAIVRLLNEVIRTDLGGELAVESLTDPTLALRRIEEGGVDLLLTDLEMPNIDGIELLRCAKNRNALAQVFFVTGHSTLDQLLAALELGATDYVLKPVLLTPLLELIRDAVTRQRRWRMALAGTWRQQETHGKGVRFAQS
jgi:DNA-binding NtrC family response regulator